ncbi:hypothetical protein [Phytoactinopolyspora mesophila]|uniref:DUF4259 domain-containing protein n=1 Tax=Phytoactinopolyspora mesophila TaxID=2650750 RepID=A0A7K3M736_9ACTN|nr:hypothetical protein [Phytoactinopolyspora mesophila]NDL59131.1 hypothetical protein [Phytoactinopolyspora mesophila]
MITLDRRLAAVFAAVALAVAACGGDDADTAATSDDDAPVIEETVDDADDEDDAGDPDLDTTADDDDAPDAAPDDLFGEVDWDALSGLGFEFSRCMELSGAAMAVASLPLTMFGEEEEVDYAEINAEVTEIINDLPDEFHPELLFVLDIINESRDHSWADPDHPLLSDEYQAAWDSYFDKLDAACELDTD